MSKPENRSQLMKYFGATQKNTVWSWCGVNEQEQSVYFSIWTDYYNKFGEKDKKYYTIQEPHWGNKEQSGSQSAGKADHDINIDKVLNHGYKAFGYFIEAKDKNIVPREIKETRTSFVFSLELEKLPTGEIICYLIDRIEVK